MAKELHPLHVKMVVRRDQVNAKPTDDLTIAEAIDRSVLNDLFPVEDYPVMWRDEDGEKSKTE